MANPQIRITNLYDNSLSLPPTAWGEPTANAADREKDIIVTLADASTVTIAAGSSAVINMAGAKAFSSIAQTSAAYDSGAKTTSPVNLG